MGKYRRSSRAAVVMILCVFLITSFSVFGDEKHHGSSSMGEGKAVAGRYWDRLKALLNQASLYFYPPNIEGGGEVNEPEGGGEKVQEAVENTVEKSKAAVEGTAKSAAEMAAKTVQNTEEKVKESLSEL